LPEAGLQLETNCDHGLGDSYHSFQIVDVLWHLSSRDISQRVTVTAYAADWHKHITEAEAAWRAAAH
jgi:hypothetical protein